MREFSIYRSINYRSINLALILDRIRKANRTEVSPWPRGSWAPPGAALNGLA